MQSTVSLHSELSFITQALQHLLSSYWLSTLSRSTVHGRATL